MAVNRMDLREKVPANIIRGARLKTTINDLFDNFEAGEQRNAELVNKFFDQPYFRGEESLITKLVEINTNIDFEYIKDEGINLALLLDNSLLWNFNGCLNKIRSNYIKSAFIQEIYSKIQSAIGTTDPYTDFHTECDITPFTTGASPNVLHYFEHVVEYLNGKEGEEKGKKVVDILKDVNITNSDLNGRLPAGQQIPTGVPLGNDHLIPRNTKDAFDALLSFEIGEEADRTIHMVGDLSNKLESLFTNSLPAINTVVGENDELKYDESKLGDEYKDRLQEIKDNNGLSNEEKSKQINDLRWEYYLKYLKKKNKKIGDALQELYDNNFDYSKIRQSVLDGYLDSVADMRLKTLFNSGAKDVLKINFGNVDSFSRFYKDLAKRSVNTIQLDESRGIDLPVEKKIEEGENTWLKDNIQQAFGNIAKPYDTLPITYTIKKSDINRLPIDVEDKTRLLIFLSKFKSDEENYIIKGGDIGKLIYLFFVINSRTPITTLDPEKQKEIEALFGQSNQQNENGGDNNQEGEDNPDNNGENDDNSDDNNPEENNPDNTQETNNEGNDNRTPTKFIENFEKLGPGKFEDGSEIRVPVGESEIPGGGYQWMKIKIDDVNMNEGTFKGSFFGGELKFGNTFEGKSREFKMNKKTFEEFRTKSKNKDKIWLQPNPENSDFNSFLNKLNGRLGTNNLSFPAGGMTWNGNKFMRKVIDDNGKEEEVEVKYFGAPGDGNATYEIKYNPIRKSFTVLSTFNGEEKGNGGKPQKTRFSYKRDMDWNNFLIFFTQKGLIPQTEQEAQNAIARQDNEFKMVNGGNWKLNWFSINNIKNAFKAIKGNIKKKIDDYDKRQDEKLEDILIGDRGLYSGLANVLGFIPSMKEGLGELEQEYYNDRDNRTWKKIEAYLKVFQADPDFGTTFEQVPPHAKIQGGKSLKDIVTNRVANATDRMGDPGIYQAAALLLANIEKGQSPYRGLAGKENSGLWVKALLGKAHYEQFIRDKQKCIFDLQNAGKEKDQIQDVLATCEMDYIINNVSGSNGKLRYFGSHEGRGIPGEEGTDYIDNPSKKILSNQFADKLKGAYKGRFNKSSVEEAYGKITHNDFNLAKEDFKRLIKSSRFPGAIANLKKMFLLAKNDEQQKEYQKCFLLYMLSGVLDINGKKDLRKQTYQWAKTMSFLPGMLAKETCHSQKVATLLDDFCQEEGYSKFSESVTSYFHEGDLVNGDLNIDALISDLDSWWTMDKMRAFEKYSKSKFPSKAFPENSTLKKLQDSYLDTGMENMDTSLLDNPLVANSGGLLSNTNVVHDRMAIRDGEFDGKDPDERNNRKEFWAKITDEVNHMNANNVQDVKLLLRQYCNWFGLSDREEIYKWIKTAYHRRNYMNREITYNDGNGHIDPMGKIDTKEIDSIIRYTFKGKVMSGRFRGSRLPKEMHNALNAFQKKFQDAFYNNILEDDEIVSDIFKIGDDSNISVLGLGSRSSYNANVTGRENSDSDDDTKAKNRIKRNFTSGNFINYYIANIEKSFRNLPSSDYFSVTTSTLDNLLDRFNTI